MPDLKFIVYNFKTLPVGLTSLNTVKKVAHRIVDEGYQLVCLNEIFHEGARDKLAEIFEKAGYHLIRKSGADYSVVQDSGLFLASKFPIIYKNFEEYTDWKLSFYLDQFANKGILGALLDLSSLNNKQDLYLYAFTTHMHSEPDHPHIRTNQLGQAKRFINSMIRLHQGYPSQENSTIAGLSKIALLATGTPDGSYLGIDDKEWIRLQKTQVDETVKFQIIKGWDTNDNTPIAYGETVHFRSHKGTYLDVDRDYYLAADEYSLAHKEVADWGHFRILKANNEADTGPIHDGDEVVLKDYDDKYVYSYRKSGTYWGCGGGNNSQKLTFQIQLQQLFLPSKIVPLDKSNAIYAGDFNLKANSGEYPNMINTLGQPQDLWQIKRPGEPGFTYATNDLDQRIDYILSFSHLPSNNEEQMMGMECKEISTLNWSESDHLPISAVFSLPNS
jgi:hypothetical protein